MKIHAIILFCINLVAATMGLINITKWMLEETNTLLPCILQIRWLYPDKMLNIYMQHQNITDIDLLILNNTGHEAQIYSSHAEDEFTEGITIFFITSFDYRDVQTRIKQYLALIYIFVFLGGNMPINEIFRLITYENLYKFVFIDGNGDIFGANYNKENWGQHFQHEFACNCAQLNLSIVKNYLEFEYRDLNGLLMTVEASTFKHFSAGIADYVLLKECAKYMNLSLHTDISNLHVLTFPDGNTYFDDILDRTYPHSMGYTVIAVPKAMELPKWRGFLNVFDTMLLMAIAATFWIHYFANYIIMKLSQQSILLFLYVYAIFCSQSVPQPTVMVMRVTFINWTVFSFIISSCYTSLFYSHLVQPIYDADINTVEEFISSGMKVAGESQCLLTQFLFSDVPGAIGMYDDSIDCGRKCLDLVAHRNVGICLTDAEFDSMQNKLAKKGSPKLHKIYLNSMLVSFRGAKGNPVIRFLEQPIQRFVEAGLFSKWEQDWRMKVAGDVKTPKALSFDHLALPFYVYCALIVTSVFVFLLELLFCNSDERNVRKKKIETVNVW